MKGFWKSSPEDGAASYIWRWAFAIITTTVLATSTFVFVDYALNRYRPIIEVLSTSIGQGPFCPGDHVLVTTEIDGKRPMILRTHMSIMDKTATRNVGGVEYAFEDIVRPIPSVFSEALPFRVPFLPRGQYTLVIVFETVHLVTEPVFVKIPISIRGDCS